MRVKFIFSITAVSLFFALAFIKFALLSDGPIVLIFWLLFLMIIGATAPLLYLSSIILLGFVLDFIENLIRTVLVKYGRKTQGTIIASYRCDDDGDTCLCGTYRFFTLGGKEYLNNFRICIHRPSGLSSF